MILHQCPSNRALSIQNSTTHCSLGSIEHFDSKSTTTDERRSAVIASYASRKIPLDSLIQNVPADILSTAFTVAGNRSVNGRLCVRYEKEISSSPIMQAGLRENEEIDEPRPLYVNMWLLRP